MRFKSSMLLASTLFFSVPSFVPIAYAASDAECAIWLCLPAGFPSSPSGVASSMTCGDAKRAMIKRIKNRKSPLPSFGSCLAPGHVNTSMSAKDGLGTYVPPYQVCERWAGGDQGNCISWRTVPEQWVQGRPEICSTERVRCQTLRWVDVFVDGEKAGGTYFFNTAGQGKLIGGDELLHQNKKENPQ